MAQSLPVFHQMYGETHLGLPEAKRWVQPTDNGPYPLARFHHVIFPLYGAIQPRRRIWIMETTTPHTWATAEDWALHRPTITRLYTGEGKTLPQVMEIMKRDHAFYATTKMYKTRIKLWGLSKHLTANDVNSILQLYGNRAAAANAAAAENANTTIFFRGRPVDLKKVEQYLRRSERSGPTRPKAFSGKSGSTVPAVRQLRSPDIFKLPDDIILLTSQLAIGSRENGLWATNNNNTMTFATDKLVGWEHQIGSGYDLARTGNYKHAFKILDNAFAMLGQFLQNPEPALFIYVTTNALIDDADIGQRLLSYAAEMSKIKLSARHPLTLIWDKLSKAGLQQIKVSAWAMLLSYLDTLEQLFGNSQENLPFIKYWLLNDAFFVGLLSKDECCAQLKATIEQCESLGQRAHALQAKSILVNILVRAKQHYEANPILDKIIEENNEDSDIYNRSIEEQSRFQRFVIYKTIETLEETIKAARECLQFVKRHHDPGYPFAVYVASVLRDYLEDHGIPVGAEKLEEFLDPDWEAFCRGLEIS